ncbi:hypothetical protein HPP92_001679 [Vanilla planifolia]|uniref:Exostosin GT47 domain-containing protein n=1 Tax=Vanilla planifolia TaxID=51239 RepID=A0A835VH60_VANPL|nr:hypothetical protein HPP92_001679 [Vanilla planifolia]
MHDLPSRFNADILRDCRALSPWTDMCLFLSNSGLGPPLPENHRHGWYATNQFSLELIFHNRMKQYPCLTPNSSLASAVFVPFYAGLDIGRHLWTGSNVSARDASGLDLARWLTSRPEWAAMGGRDHFFVAGRITWDFRRQTEAESDWGSKLLLLPAIANMTALVIESSPWHANDVGVPYPSYFHPGSDAEVAAWQGRARWRRRPWLFSFVGGARPNRTDDIREMLMSQCRASARCALVECRKSDPTCHSPERVMRVFERSVFCLQPQGDSYTRRSAFDSMVAGCVPVFFHPGSAYVQYRWHLPRHYSEYSVFIPEEEVRQGRVRVEEVLMGFGESQVRRMRERVVGLIPGLIYGDPKRRMESMKDAFDVAVEGIIERVANRMRKGEDGEEENTLTLNSDGKNQWEHFFSMAMPGK